MSSEEEKKPYTTPQLIVYGDIRIITKTVDNNGPADGPAGGNMDKTG